MRTQNLNRGWEFRNENYYFVPAAACKPKGKIVNLPHDFMLEGNVSPDAPAGAAMGYYNGGIGSYTKIISIPAEWESDKTALYFDGVMMNASVDVNGSRIALHHYGYTPFYVDLTPYLYFGEENRITVTINNTMQPNSRWYTGSGIYRNVKLVHTPRLHVAHDGIFAYTTRIEWADGKPRQAFVTAEITVANETLEDRLVTVACTLAPENGNAQSIERSTAVLVKAGKEAIARIPMTVDNPALWDAEHPNLYRVTASVTEQGIFRSCLLPAKAPLTDSDSTLFGVRVFSADSSNGLLVNGRTVKLKGGCIHHDNGILGASSFYDSEYRKLKKLKENGYNAVRLAHNPPSTVLLEACDRLGLYVFNEAFDAWFLPKQNGDYNQFFAEHWKEDMTAFIKRDRNHPSILFWSTGNEIPERGGLSDGYELARQMAEHVRFLDPTRLVSNGMCSYWCGIDDKNMLAFSKQLQDIVDSGASLQNASLESGSTWEDRSEAYLSCLDVVGYNYLENHYEQDEKHFPERVIVGTESFPMAISRVWKLVEKLPYVIGDFTWTCYDYIGEAGIGKSVFHSDSQADSPENMSSQASKYPWRLANDADFDINGTLLPQGVFRSIVWGSNTTGLYVQNPAHFHEREEISRWGWPELSADWNWKGYEGMPVRVTVYSAAEEVELFLNGKSLGLQPAGKEHDFTAVFCISYAPGTLEAVSLTNSTEVSRASLYTAGVPAALRLVPEQTTLRADGLSLAYVGVEIVDAEGLVVPDASLPLTAAVCCPASVAAGDELFGEETAACPAENTAADCTFEKERASCPSDHASLAGFGSANPVTEENYTAGSFTSYHGRAMAVVRSGYVTEEAVLTVSCEGLGSVSVPILIK